MTQSSYINKFLVATSLSVQLKSQTLEVVVSVLFASANLLMQGWNRTLLPLLLPLNSLKCHVRFKWRERWAWCWCWVIDHLQVTSQTKLLFVFSPEKNLLDCLKKQFQEWNACRQCRAMRHTMSLMCEPRPLASDQQFRDPVLHLAQIHM